MRMRPAKMKSFLSTRVTPDCFLGRLGLHSMVVVKHVSASAPLPWRTTSDSRFPGNDYYEHQVETSLGLNSIPLWASWPRTPHLSHQTKRPAPPGLGQEIQEEIRELLHPFDK